MSNAGKPSDDKLSGLVEQTLQDYEAGETDAAAVIETLYEATTALQQQLRVRDEALEQAENDLLNIADGCGYRYHHETILKAVSAALAKVRKALSTPEDSDR